MKKLKVWLQTALVVVGIAASGLLVWWFGNRWYADTLDLPELLAAGEPGPLRYALKWRPEKLLATDSLGRTPLHLAVARPDPSLAELLLRAGAPVNARDRQGRTPLHVATDSGRLPLVQLLLAAGADANAADREGWTPLHQAAARDFASVVTALVNAGARVNARDKDGGTPLDWACLLLQQEEAVQALRQNGGKTAAELGAGPLPR